MENSAAAPSEHLDVISAMLATTYRVLMTLFAIVTVGVMTTALHGELDGCDHADDYFAERLTKYGRRRGNFSVDVALKAQLARTNLCTVHVR